ncbi:MAG: APC family permease, partial [Microcystaceae cyanobacterium]
MDESPPSSPQPTLSLLDAIALIIGIVVGAGIYKTPSEVAANVDSELLFLLLWLAGGAVSLVGALCYAELATAYPHVGGEYHYLARAFGRELAFLLAWARLSVMQTGSIVLLAFIVGDYCSQLLALGPYSSSIYAAVTLAGLTALNAIGIKPGKWGQNWLSAAKLLGLVLVIAVGLALPWTCVRACPSEPPPLSGSSSAAIFVLLTYGGWSEAAYLSAEVRDAQRNLVKALVISLSAITVIFLLVNVAYLRGLGLEGMARSPAVAADLMRCAWGKTGVQLLSFLVALSALGAMNGTIFTGSRTNCAWGQDVKLLSFLGRWHHRHHTPWNALLVQGAMALG